MATFTPREIVSELDRYIVGQREAKRAVAIALRNRWRRMQVPEPLRDEIAPKNIIMIGPTGVGKTEISRRLAKLAQAPFIKVEASKFTEVGYVGRDVESIIRDLTELALTMVREEEKEKNRVKAREHAEDRVLDLLLPPPPKTSPRSGAPPPTRPRRARSSAACCARESSTTASSSSRSPSGSPMIEVMTPPGMEEIESNLRELLQNVMPKRTKQTKMLVPEALDALEQEEASRLIDRRPRRARRSVGSSSRESSSSTRSTRSPAARASTVPTSRARACSATSCPSSRVDGHHEARPGADRPHPLHRVGRVPHLQPSDLIPEFQGRFPIRVELEALTQADFVRILTEPENALTKQYIALLATEGVGLVFRDDAVDEIARIAAEVNERTENIGARRLHTVMERLLDQVSFDAPGDGRTAGRDRCGVRARAAGADSRGPGPVPLHPLGHHPAGLLRQAREDHRSPSAARRRTRKMGPSSCASGSTSGRRSSYTRRPSLRCSVAWASTSWTSSSRLVGRQHVADERRHVAHARRPDQLTEEQPAETVLQLVDDGDGRFGSRRIVEPHGARDAEPVAGTRSWPRQLGAECQMAPAVGPREVVERGLGQRRRRCEDRRYFDSAERRANRCAAVAVVAPDGAISPACRRPAWVSSNRLLGIPPPCPPSSAICPNSDWLPADSAREQKAVGPSGQRRPPCR